MNSAISYPHARYQHISRPFPQCCLVGPRSRPSAHEAHRSQRKSRVLRYVSTKATRPSCPSRTRCWPALRATAALVPKGCPSCRPRPLPPSPAGPFAEVAVRIARALRRRLNPHGELTAIALDAYPCFGHPAVTLCPDRPQPVGAGACSMGDAGLQGRGDAAPRRLMTVSFYRGERVTIVAATSGDTAARPSRLSAARSGSTPSWLFPQGPSPTRAADDATETDPNVPRSAYRGHVRNTTTASACEALITGCPASRFAIGCSCAAVNAINGGASSPSSPLLFSRRAAALGSPHRSGRLGAHRQLRRRIRSYCPGPGPAGERLVIATTRERHAPPP